MKRLHVDLDDKLKVTFEFLPSPLGSLDNEYTMTMQCLDIGRMVVILMITNICVLEWRVTVVTVLRRTFNRVST